MMWTMKFISYMELAFQLFWHSCIVTEIKQLPYFNLPPHAFTLTQMDDSAFLQFLKEVMMSHVNTVIQEKMFFTVFLAKLSAISM